jgi:hypothetical protein
MSKPEAVAAWERRLDFEVGSSELVGRSPSTPVAASALAELRLSQGWSRDPLTAVPASFPVEGGSSPRKIGRGEGAND